ncbi:Exp1p [Lachancea thermotolerans CBS 6340]|uniref:KLTH0G10956p n=1 Tax=Lachancea thermotolerans (strain ATCC 56472 / CBS 6340 / NRRL Y-8284) TaxID=559295 RepID=C5DMR1_LACTC|nr:KLTH0G10956p [Lachancea thermotolerans CBS 6340]CAR25072.1 KLTH0G10956p [Lachancea thermotolerans CBS 6340]
MDFYAFLVLFVIIVAFVLLLPLLSGTFAYKFRKPAARAGKTDHEHLSRTQKLKEKLEFSKDENPIKFQLRDNASTSSRNKPFEVDSKTGLKKRTIGKYSADPNEFDYDLTELIEEDVLEEKKENELRYQQFAGREQEESEALV